MRADAGPREVNTPSLEARDIAPFRGARNQARPKRLRRATRHRLPAAHFDFVALVDGAPRSMGSPADGTNTTLLRRRMGEVLRGQCPVADVGKKIGGKVGQNIKAGFFQNACPMRMSYLLGHVPSASRSRQRHVHPRGRRALEFSLTVRQLGLVIGLLQCIACAFASVGSAENAQATLLEKRAMSRCLAKAGAGSPAGDDAAKTAAAYLEQGTVGIEVYEKLEALASGYLEREYTGSVKSNYNTMKCLDLVDSDELDRLVRDSTQ